MNDRDEPYEGHLTDQDLRAGHADTGDPMRDPDGWDAGQYSDDIRRTKEGRS